MTSMYSLVNRPKSELVPGCSRRSTPPSSPGSQLRSGRQTQPLFIELNTAINRSALCFSATVHLTGKTVKVFYMLGTVNRAKHNDHFQSLNEEREAKS